MMAMQVRAKKIFYFIFAFPFFVALVVCQPVQAKIPRIHATRWPVQLTYPWQRMISSFGPRLLNNRYDFHRGIDLPGTSNDLVVAISQGKIFRVYEANDPNSPYPNSGNVVIVKHRFRSPYLFHGRYRRTYYSVYAHLDRMVPDLYSGMVVQRGMHLGYIGASGNASYPHLHFEIRIGTVCAQASQCGRGYDPHVNPLLFLPYPNTTSGSVKAAFVDSVLKIRTTMPQTELDLNRLVIRPMAQEKIQAGSIVLNFNTRRGFNVSSTAALDAATVSGIKISPKTFTAKTSIQKMTFRLIKGCASFAHADAVEIALYDIWNARMDRVRLSCPVKE